MSKVSILIPAYNAACYLAKTLDSVLAQSYQDYEVIVVDNGSTDDTCAIAMQYKYRVKTLSKAHGGPASARNMAIKHSTGEYLAFLDSDDIWLENKLVEQVDYMDSNLHAGLVFSKAFMFTEESSKLVIKKIIGYTDNPSLRMLLFGNFIPNSSVVIRSKCVGDVGFLNEKESLIGAEDYEYWLRIARRYSIAGIERPLVYYRLHDNNLSGAGKNIDRNLSAVMVALRELEEFCPTLWTDYEVDRELLFARLHIRAGFAWRQERQWGKCLEKFGQAIAQSKDPRVMRWIIAATVLKQWS